jgi:hypothetical protein
MSAISPILNQAKKLATWQFIAGALLGAIAMYYYAQSSSSTGGFCSNFWSRFSRKTPVLLVQTPAEYAEAAEAAAEQAEHRGLDGSYADLNGNDEEDESPAIGAPA